MTAICPYCGDEDECEHLVACLEESEGFLAGAIGGAWEDWNERITQQFLDQLRAGRPADGWSREFRELFAHLQDALEVPSAISSGVQLVVDKEKFEDAWIELDGMRVLSDQAEDWLRQHPLVDGADVSIPSGDSPSLSWSSESYYAKDPSVILKEFELLK